MHVVLFLGYLLNLNGFLVHIWLAERTRINRANQYTYLLTYSMVQSPS